MHQSPEYWIEKTDGAGEVLGDAAWVAAFNARSYAADPHLADLAGYPDTVPGAELEALIRSVSTPHETDLYFREDPESRALTAADFDRYRENLDLDAILETVAVRFALVLERTNMRTWPTRDAVFSSPETRDLDRFQENGLFPGEEVAVLHESSDGEWSFVRSYNYHAWVRKVRLVKGAREEIMAYAKSERFLVVTGSRATTMRVWSVAP